MKSSFLWSNVLKGNTLYRTIMNAYIQRYAGAVSGTIIDIGAGRNPEYGRYLSHSATVSVAEYDKRSEPDYQLDCNSEDWNIQTASFDAAFLFNVLYILEDPCAVIARIHALLKPHGEFFMAVPFVFHERPEPHDYWRFTAEKLQEMCSQAGFAQVDIIPMGNRCSTAAHVIAPLLRFRVFKGFVYSCALACDRFVPASLSFPFGFFVIGKKS